MMRNLSPLDLGSLERPAAVTGRAPSPQGEPRPRPRDDTTQEAAPPPPAAPSVADMEDAVKQLQDALDQASGPRREVELLFDDGGDYTVEVRRQSDGFVIQRFPPENLLNPKGNPADLLGTVVDRLS